MNVVHRRTEKNGDVKTVISGNKKNQQENVVPPRLITAPHCTTLQQLTSSILGVLDNFLLVSYNNGTSISYIYIAFT